MQLEQYKLHADIEDHHWWFRGRRQIMRLLAHRLLPPESKGTVIDIGCGTGANLAALADDYRVLGIDASPDAIEFAHQRFPAVDFTCGEIPVALGAEYSSPRLFLLMDVLEHVADDVSFLERATSMLDPGDLMLLTVPADMTLWSQHDVSFGHYRRYDIGSLRATWRGFPLKVEMLSYFNARIYPIVKSIRFLSRLFAKPWGEAGTDLAVPIAPVNQILERIFASEVSALLELLDGQRRRGYRFGVSLLAVLRAVA